MKDNIRMIKSKVLVFFNLEMAESTKVNGKMVDSTVKVYSVRKI